MLKTEHADAKMQQGILRLLAERERGKTICPSEAARAVAGEDGAAWRPRMEAAREAARALAQRGEIVITQGGRPLDPEEEVRGPIRLRLP